MLFIVVVRICVSCLRSVHIQREMYIVYVESRWNYIVKFWLTVHLILLSFQIITQHCRRRRPRDLKWI